MMSQIYQHFEFAMLAYFRHVLRGIQYITDDTELKIVDSVKWLRVGTEMKSRYTRSQSCICSTSDSRNNTQVQY